MNDTKYLQGVTELSLYDQEGYFITTMPVTQPVPCTVEYDGTLWNLVHDIHDVFSYEGKDYGWYYVENDAVVEEELDV